MTVSRARFRRSPHLISYWENGRLVIHNYATGSAMTASALAMRILDYFDRWRGSEGLCAELPEFSRSSLDQAVELLAKHTFLQRSDRPVGSAERDMDTWRHWNPAAGFFHFSTKDLPYEGDRDRVVEFLEWRVSSVSQPARVKKYRRAPSVRLPPAKKDGEFSRVLLDRRTWRRFARTPLPVSELGTLLGLTFGVQMWMDLGVLGRAALKTSPSGGARHPIEAYLIARRVQGISPGIYHYDAEAHGLARLREGMTRDRIESYLPGQPWYRVAPAVVFMTAIFRRTEWKYPYARAYRSVLFEAGHLCQTFCLLATWLGLAPFCTAALADRRIEDDLGIDGIRESVLYACGVGSRPRNVDWAPGPSPETPRRYPPHR